jgi:hypothetical protein
MPSNPMLVWQYVKLIVKRETAHCNVAFNMTMTIEDGPLAKSPEEHLEIMHIHFNHIFNNNFTVLEHVTKRKVMNFLDGDITFGKLKRAVTKLKTHKAPSLNGVPPEVFKLMNDECLKHVLKYLNNFWN